MILDASWTASAVTEGPSIPPEAQAPSAPDASAPSMPIGPSISQAPPSSLVPPPTIHKLEVVWKEKPTVKIADLMEFSEKSLGSKVEGFKWSVSSGFSVWHLRLDGKKNLGEVKTGLSQWLQGKAQVNEVPDGFQTHQAPSVVDSTIPSSSVLQPPPKEFEMPPMPETPPLE